MSIPLPVPLLHVFLEAVVRVVREEDRNSRRGHSTASRGRQRSVRGRWLGSKRWRWMGEILTHGVTTIAVRLNTWGGKHVHVV